MQALFVSFRGFGELARPIQLGGECGDFLIALGLFGRVLFGLLALALGFCCGSLDTLDSSAFLRGGELCSELRLIMFRLGEVINDRLFGLANTLQRREISFDLLQAALFCQ